MILEILRQLLTSATHDASAVMCRWTDGLITLSLDEVQELPLVEAMGRLEVEDEVLTMVAISLEGDLGGEVILTFDEKNGRSLAATLVKSEAPPVEGGEWTEMQRSALNETGNILACAYANALTRLIGAELRPTPPMFLQDYGACVLEQALSMQAVAGDRAIVCRTLFHSEGEELDWRVFFVPTVGLQERMSETVHMHA